MIGSGGPSSWNDDVPARVFGRYSFRPSVPAGGDLRPLRDPAEADDEDTDE
ncbi:hypothetical protein ACFV7Q_31595 [Streptomyces sp. NPDC059851]|uniref:hypothetical protein n=1 Tax=Streptomyces sp. NPDC059851 TaxID=3346971 RepID=UPI00366613F1